MPEDDPDNVVLVPEPVTDPGFIVHPPEGSPLNAALPVATVQVGWEIVPTTGAEGAGGCDGISIVEDAGDTQPPVFVTV